MNTRAVGSILGKVLLAEAALLLLPMLTALICHESAFPFLCTIGLLLPAGGALTAMKPESADKGWRYPYHMIDFETTAVALPFYEGMRPYEQVAFQFYHHVIHEDGTIEHAGQYINTGKHHVPNFEFVRHLKEELEKDEGTIFRYATHENTILRDIRRQLEASQEEDRQVLMDFIDSITYHGEGKNRVHGRRDMVDLLEVVRAVALARGSSFEEVEQIRRRKAEKRGGFEKRILLETVTEK